MHEQSNEGGRFGPLSPPEIAKPIVHLKTDLAIALCLGLGSLSGRSHQKRLKKTAATIVQIKASAINFPMLEVPGLLESHRLPNAVAVVMALKTTARVKLDCSRPVFPARHAIM